MTDIRDLVQALADTSARVWLLDPELGEQWDGTAALITETINAARRDGYESGMREGVRVSPRVTLDRTFLEREKQRLLSSADRYWTSSQPVTARHVIDEWFALFEGALRNEPARMQHRSDPTGFDAADQLLTPDRLQTALAGMVSLKTAMEAMGVKDDDNR